MRRCDACGADGARRRCSKCQACWVCDKACAKRAWGIHKLYCTEDPALRRHVATELAFARVLAKAPTARVPDDAVCYVCLDGGDVVRACACRGPSAGFAHVDCLAEMAAQNEFMTVQGRGDLSRWEHCGVCYQLFTGVLEVELCRRAWRHHRDAQETDVTRGALATAGNVLAHYDEGDAAARLCEEAKRGLAGDDPRVLEAEVARADAVRQTNPDAALEMLKRLRPRIARCEDAGTRMMFATSQALVLGFMDRYQEAAPFAAEAVEIETLCSGPEDARTLDKKKLRAVLLIESGRVDEGTAMLTQVFVTQTRVLGADHVDTQDTKMMLNEYAPGTA